MNAGPVCVNVIASPSGSEALNAWFAVEPAATVMLLSGVRTTGRSTLFTVTVKVFPSLATPSLALTDTDAVPASENPGDRATFPVAVPVPADVVVTVAYVGPDTLANVSAWPSASVAESGLLAVVPSFTVTFAGCARTGAWFTLFTVTVKVLPSDAAPSLALTDTDAVPASENPGERATFPVAVPVPADVVVTVAYVGPETLANVSAWPSGSVAESGLFAVVPSFTVTFAGCASVGAWFVAVTVIVKLLGEVVPFAAAVTDAANVPEVPSAGARLTFPVRVVPT